MWRKLSRGCRSNALRLQQHSQDLVLKLLTVASNLAENLYNPKNISNPLKLVEFFKIPVKQGTDTVALLRKANHDLLTCKKDPATPEPYANYRQLCFVQRDHPELLFGVDLPKTLQDILETNKIGIVLSRKSTFHFITQKIPKQSSVESNILYQGWGPRGRYQQKKTT